MREAEKEDVQTTWEGKMKKLQSEVKEKEKLLKMKHMEDLC